MPKATGDFIEIAVELPNKLKGNDASTYKSFKLPKDLYRDTVPATLAKFLTSKAWNSICIEMRDQQWECHTGEQIGSSLADKLATQYKPLKISFKQVAYFEPVRRAPMGALDVLVFKLVIDTASADAPEQPMSAQSTDSTISTAASEQQE
jgi:hypothetical protein